MDAVNLTIGGICVPLGFYLIVEKPELKTLGAAAVILGLLCWLLAYWMVRTKAKRERQERTEERAKEQIERGEVQRLLTDILQELRRFNQSKE